MKKEKKRIEEETQKFIANENNYNKHILLRRRKNNLIQIDASPLRRKN